MKENKKYLILILFLIIMIGGLSWAYFRTQIAEGVHLPINVTTDIPEELIFHIDHDLTLNVNQFTLTENGKNLTDSTEAQATYKAGTKNRKTEEYYVYLNIVENTYIYTTTEEKPEILLKVEGPDGEIKTDLNNGEIHYNEELKGYDITTKKGLINIALDQEISSEGNEVTIDNWKFTITFINLETNQSKNADKTLKTQIIMQKDKIEPLTEHIKKLYTIDGENNLYYHDGTGEYTNVSLEAGDNSYRYAGGDYHVTKKAINEGYNTIYDIIPLKTNDGVIHKNNYWWGDTNRYLYLAYDEQNSHSTSLGTLLNRAIKDGYIEKIEINNYVCFGSSDSVCPKDNLYRIIGVFNNQVKLIKAGSANKEQLGDDGSFGASLNHDITYIGDDAYKKDAYYWHKEGTSKQAAWTDSSLNTVNLNTNFVKYLTDLEDGKWIEKIVNTDWQVSGMTYQNGNALGAKTAYDYELVNNKNLLIVTNKIGLMYVSDYYYATLEKYWSLMGYNDKFQDGSIEEAVDYRGAIWDNWLWSGDTEWLITPNNVSSAGNAFLVSNLGSVNPYGISVRQRAIRPVFYLMSDIKYVSGDGSLNNPFRIE